MKPTNKFLVAALMSLFLCLVLESSARAQGFNEQFNSSTLDPAWQLIQYPGARVFGFSSPANHFSLIDHPGHLRYYLDPMTHADGFINGFQTTFSEHSCCNHDPGLELRRTFEGEEWTLESKVTYHMPFANGRHFGLRIYFGDGGPGTFFLVLDRTRDVNFNRSALYLVEKSGPALFDRTFHQFVQVDMGNITANTQWFRIERAGDVLTALWSDDGITWNTAWVHDLGNALDGLDQRVVITGLSWFVPAGSYADYDYVSVTPTNQPPVAISQNVTVSAGANCRANVSVDNGSFDPNGDPITISQSPAGPYPIGSTPVTLTVTDSKGASSQSTSTVTVVDNTPPAISSVSVDKPILGPPNHNMIDVIVSYSTSDNCDANAARVLSVTSNESIDGTGDGDTTPDWEVVDAHHVRLRAERAGTGSGRIYLITITCTDSAGNSSSRAVMVTVPKNQR